MKFVTEQQQGFQQSSTASAPRSTYFLKTPEGLPMTKTDL